MVYTRKGNRTMMENKYYQDMVELIELYNMLHETPINYLKDEERIEKLKEFRILINNFYKKEQQELNNSKVDRIKEVYAIVDPQTGCIRDNVYAEISLLKQKKEKDLDNPASEV
jgi:hypothetical protein